MFLENSGVSVKKNINNLIQQTCSLSQILPFFYLISKNNYFINFIIIKI